MKHEEVREEEEEERRKEGGRRCSLDDSQNEDLVFMFFIHSHNFPFFESEICRRHPGYCFVFFPSLISASSSTPATSVSLCPTGTQLGFGPHRRTIRPRRERARRRMSDGARGGGGRKNHFCFRKPHMSCTANVVVI